jgi:hypothetical protein
MFRPVLLAALVLAVPATAQTVHTVGAAGDFPTPQAAVDAAAPGDIVILLQGVIGNVVIDKGIAFMGAHNAIIKPQDGPGSTAPPVHVIGVPAGQSVLISGLNVFVGNQGAPATVLIEDCDGPVWIQDAFVDSYGAGALVAHDASSVVLVEAAMQTNLIPALPDGTPVPAAGAKFSGATRAFVHGAFLFGSHGTLQGFGNPVPTAAPDGGPGLLVIDSQVKVTGTDIRGGSGNSFFSGGCTFAGNGGAGVVTLEGADPGSPTAMLTSSPVTGGGVGHFTPSCAPAPVPGVPLDVLPGSLTVSSALPRELYLNDLAEPGLPVTLSLDGAAGDLALLFGSTAAAPALAVSGIDLHLKPDALFLVTAFALPTGSLDLPAIVPPLPAGLDAVVVPLQAVFVDTQGGKHASAPRVLVIH